VPISFWSAGLLQASFEEINEGVGRAWNKFAARIEHLDHTIRLRGAGKDCLEPALLQLPGYGVVRQPSDTDALIGSHDDRALQVGPEGTLDANDALAFFGPKVPLVWIALLRLMDEAVMLPQILRTGRHAVLLEVVGRRADDIRRVAKIARD